MHRSIVYSLDQCVYARVCVRARVCICMFKKSYLPVWL